MFYPRSYISHSFLHIPIRSSPNVTWGDIINISLPLHFFQNPSNPSQRTQSFSLSSLSFQPMFCENTQRRRTHFFADASLWDTRIVGPPDHDPRSDPSNKVAQAPSSRCRDLIKNKWPTWVPQSQNENTLFFSFSLPLPLFGCWMVDQARPTSHGSAISMVAPLCPAWWTDQIRDLIIPWAPPHIQSPTVWVWYLFQVHHERVMGGLSYSVALKYTWEKRRSHPQAPIQT